MGNRNVMQHRIPFSGSLDGLTCSLSVLVVAFGLLLIVGVASANPDLIRKEQVENLKLDDIRPSVTVFGEEFDITEDSYLEGEEGSRIRLSELRDAARFGNDSHVVTMEVLPPDRPGGNRRVKTLRVDYLTVD